MREAAGYGPTAPRRFAYVRAWRLRKKILVPVSIALTIIAVSAAVGAEHWRANYQPLEAAMYTTQSTAPSFTPNLPSDTEYWRYTKGATVVIGVDVHNTGRATVTITGFVMPTSPYGPIVPTQLRVAPNPVLDNFWKRATPFARLSVHPGEDFTIYVVMKIVSWKLGSDSFVTQPLPTFNVEVMGHQHRLPITGSAIGVVGPS
jgi:hypothetical protein